MGTPFVDYRAIRGRDPRDRVPDYSFAGYRHCTAPLPISQPATVTIYPDPHGKDQTEEIQKALDGPNVVLLTPGVFRLENQAPVMLRKPGAVLRGAGPGQTIIDARGPPSKIIQFGAFKPGDVKKEAHSEIKDDYVPVGATSVGVRDPKKFVGKIGQEIRCVSNIAGSNAYRIRKLASEKWIQAQGMDKLHRDGKQQTWLPPGAELYHTRKITHLEGDRIHFDIPLVDSIDAAMDPQATVQIIKAPNASRENGLESMTIRLYFNDVGNKVGQPAHTAVSISSWVTDSWIANVHIEQFFQFIKIADEAKRLTIQDCVFRRPGKADTSRGHASDIEFRSTETLILRCRSEEDAGWEGFAAMTQSRVTGPNALVAYSHAWSKISPHRLLVDNCEGKAIEFKSRKTAGSGHGWPMGNGLAWNSKFREVMVSSPPVGTNWAVGVQGKMNPKSPSDTEFFVHYGQPVAPQSLFAYQLEQRLGPDAVRGVLNVEPQGVHPVIRHDLRPPVHDEL